MWRILPLIKVEYRARLSDLSLARSSAQPVQSSELLVQNAASAEVCVAVHAIEHLLRATRMEVILRHKIQKLSEAFTDLIHELREGDLPGDQTLTSLGDLQTPQPTIGMPDDEPRDDILDAR